MENLGTDEAPLLDANERMLNLLHQDRPVFDNFCHALGLDAEAAAKSLQNVKQAAEEGLRD